MATDGKAMVYVGTWITEDTNLWQALCESGCGWTVLCDSNREFIRHLAIWAAPARPRTGGSAHAGGHACRPPAWAALWRWATAGIRLPLAGGSGTGPPRRPRRSRAAGGFRAWVSAGAAPRPRPGRHWRLQPEWRVTVTADSPIGPESWVTQAETWVTVIQPFKLWLS